VNCSCSTLRRYLQALFYFFCQLACLIGVVVSLLLGKTFLLTETPIGGAGTFSPRYFVILLCGVKTHFI
jgi:hypothetical protein